MRALFLCGFHPSHNAVSSGQKIVAREIDRLTAQGWEVVTVSFENELECRHVKQGPEKALGHDSRIFRLRPATRVLAALRLPSLPFAASARPFVGRSYVQQLLSRNVFDRIDVEFIQAADVLPREYWQHAHLVSHDVLTQLYQRRRNHASKWRKLAAEAELARVKSWETAVLCQFGRVSVLNEKDKELVEELTGRTDLTVRYPEVPRYIDPSERNSDTINPSMMLFWGHLGRIENVDAVHYFVSEIMPRIRAQRPDAYLVVAGIDPPQSIRDLERTGHVQVTGFVPDPAPLFRSAALGIVPLRLGAGIKIKTIEMVACGMPVVTTSVGAEGVVPNPLLLTADSAPAFADEVLSLLRRSTVSNSMLNEQQRLPAIADSQPSAGGVKENQNHQSSAGQFVRATSMISVVRLVGRGALFLATLAASRRLSTDGFGAYAYVLTFFTAINLVGGLGLEQLALVAFGKARANGDPGVLRGVLSLLAKRAALTLPIASLVLAIPVSYVLGRGLDLCYFIASGCCLTAIVICASFLRGLDRPLATSIVQESGRGLALVFGVAPLYLGGTLKSVYLWTLVSSGVFALAAVCAALAAVTRASRSMNAVKPTTAPDVTYKTGLPKQRDFFFVLIATNAFLWVCPILLKTLSGIQEVGLFNVAMQFPSVISFIATSLEMIYVPKIAACWHGGCLKETRPLLRMGSWVTIAACLPISFVLVFFGKQLLSIYGSEYRHAGHAMYVIALAQLISAACGPSGYFVLLTGREKLNLFGMAASAVAGILVLALFASSLGHMAAALGFALATASFNVFFAIYSEQKLGINTTILSVFHSRKKMQKLTFASFPPTLPSQ
jgi:O-antigen/teichoic acid export membrane protein/glycosyltransferase involved in cell wall biosynthesis